MDISIDGIVPVMLTPLRDDDTIDEAGLARLIDWYLANGADALFAVCQSSEMQKLTLDERVRLARLSLEMTGGRVPVIASGHISTALDDQVRELRAVAETGVGAVVMVTNRLDPDNAGTDAFRAHLDHLMANLPSDLPLGLYECPAPYRRLLSDDELKLCRDTGRFVALKDVACDLETVRRRAALCEGSPLHIVNANAAIALGAMRAGSTGFSGVLANLVPDLYAYLYANRNSDTPLMRDLDVFLALAAMFEGMGYPKIAKRFHRRLGTFASEHSRVVAYDVAERHWALDVILDHIGAGAEALRARIREDAGRRAG